MVRRVVPIEPHQHLRRSPRGKHYRLGLHPGVRGQVGNLPGRYIDAEEPPVLVSPLVLNVQQMPVVVSPPIRPDAPVAIVCHSCGMAAGLVAHPHVQYSSDRRQVGDPGAIPGDGSHGSVGVAEQDPARDQVCAHRSTSALLSPSLGPREHNPESPAELPGNRTRVAGRCRAKVTAHSASALRPQRVASPP